MTLDEKNSFLKDLDADAFRTLGGAHIAYVREVLYEGNTHFAIHSADGKAIAIAPNKDAALNAIQSEDMQPATLH
jgi:hypothetical protein